MEPGKRKPAPESLRLVQAFVNTRDIEDGIEELGSPQALSQWLKRNGLLRGRMARTRPAVRDALAVREALRDLLSSNNGTPGSQLSYAILKKAARAADLTIHFENSTPILEPAADGVAGALGLILVSVYRAMIDGSWQRLKACRNEGCRWAFYDYSKNKSGTWCAMAICGNRFKVRAYRGRH